MSEANALFAALRQAADPPRFRIIAASSRVGTLPTDNVEQTARIILVFGDTVFSLHPHGASLARCSPSRSACSRSQDRPSPVEHARRNPPPAT
jgi:hypothetical protein